jgi:hypothetical protein
MKKLSISLIVPALFISLLLFSGCAARLGSSMPEGQGYGNGAAGIQEAEIPGTGGAGAQYDRGREDYPGQNYATLVGAGSNASAGRPSGNTGTRMSAGGGASPDNSGLMLMSIKSPVRQGETAALSFRGKPDTQYTITGVYSRSGKMTTSTVARRSGNDGIVGIEWNISRQTDPGTYGIMITGGGEQISASYTVIE